MTPEELARGQRLAQSMFTGSYLPEDLRYSFDQDMNAPMSGDQRNTNLLYTDATNPYGTADQRFNRTYDAYKQPDGTYKVPGPGGLDTGYQKMMDNYVGPIMMAIGAGGMGAGIAGIGAGAGAGSGFGAGGEMLGGAESLSGANAGAAGAASGAGGLGDIGQILKTLQSIPGGGQIATQLLQSLMSGGGTSGAGGAGAGGIGSLLPLLGIGSGLSTMFGNHPPAVDPNMINALWQAGQQTFQTAQDPRQALHDRTQQQVVDSTRAGEAARGLTMSPYGAGVENKAVSDFNIDWQNQQLQRMMQGTQAFTGAGNTAANAGVANNAQAFLQNQTGLNNLTTGLNGLFGGGGTFGAAANPIGMWLNSLMKGSGTGTPSGATSPGYTVYDPNNPGGQSQGGGFDGQDPSGAFYGP